MRQWAYAIIIVTTVFMIVPIIGLFDDPVYLLTRQWRMYLLFLIAPYTVGGALLYLARRWDRP